MCITDNVLNENYNCVDAILGGGVTCFDAMMPFAYNHLNDAKNDPVVVNAMVNAMHHNLYTIINSAAMNGVGPETTVKAVTPSTFNTIAIVTVVLGVAGIGGCILFRKKD
jgi:beta-glucosidase